MNPQVAVVDGEREHARGVDLAQLRVACASAARARVGQIARDLFGSTIWRRFELDRLPVAVRVPEGSGFLTLFPTLGVHEDRLQVELEWTAEEASLRWLDSAVRLAGSMLESQVRALAKSITASAPLILSASPYLGSSELTRTALHLAIRQAGFADEEAPRTRNQFAEAVERASARLPQALEENLAAIAAWMAEAAAVRRALDDPRVAASREAADESREHLHGLLSGAAIRGTAPQWLRQLPRYLKAEQRRWQRNAGRGVETPQILQQIREFNLRSLQLHRQMQAQGRMNRNLQDLRFWLEEFRVSLYAQELKTLAPISALRLEQRAAEIEAWLRR
jgi:ATP-dependent helicase HrpA